MTSPLVQAMTFQNAVQPAQSGIAPTDVVGAYKLATDTAEKNYQLQLAKQQALWGGLAGIGSAGILGFGPSLAKKYFGAGVTPSGTAGVPATATGTAADASAIPGAAAPTSGSLGDVGLDGAFPAFGVDAAGSGAPTVAADMGLGGAADAGAGSVGADLGLAGLGDAAAGTAGAGAADAAGATAAAGLPDWLASMLPFLAL